MRPPTPSQREAILSADRHLLVAAGAGTGKTTTVVGRILYLLGAEVAGGRIAAPVPLERIGAITYTNAAAADLKRKLRAELRAAGLRDVAYQVDTARIGTIHGFCGDILRESALRAGRTPPAEILEEGESGALTAEAVRDALITTVEAGDVPGLDVLVAVHPQVLIEEWAARLAGDGDRLARLAANPSLNAPERALVDLALRARGLVEERLERRGAVDFDRMIVWTRDLLRDQPAVCRVLQRRLHTLIVDEFQDVDPVQKDIAWLLGAPASGRADTPRLMLVGDPKQSIYRFRRADVTVWRSVEEAFRRDGLGGVVTLQDNFRSTAPILGFVDAALGPVLDTPVSGAEPQDFEVRYQPVRAAADEAGGEPALPAVEILLVSTDHDGDPRKSDERRLAEAEAVAHRAAQLRDAGVPLRDMAALFASTRQLTVYQEALERAGVRTYALRGEGFYDRREVVDLLLALDAIREPRNDMALYGFLRSPFVGLRDETLLQIARRRPAPRWTELELAPTGEWELLKWGRELLAEHVALRDRVPIHELLESLVERSGYLAHLALKGPAADQAIANVRKLLRLAREHAGVGVGDFLRMVTQLRDRGEREGDERLYGERDDVMTLTTIHSAKGLEWDTVFWCDLERQRRDRPGADRLIIGRDALAFKDPDAGKNDPQPAAWVALKAAEEAESAAEEKRLWYVAATRARRRLILSGVAAGAPARGAASKTAGQRLVMPLGLREDEDAEVSYADQDGVCYTAVVRLAHPPAPVAAPGQVDWWTAPLPGMVPAQVEPLPPLAGPARYSATSLMMHGRCPRRHWLRYVAGLAEPPVTRQGEAYLSAIARGQIVHDALEQLSEETSVEQALGAVLDERGEELPGADAEGVRAVRAMLEEEIRRVADQPDYRAVAENPTSRRELPFVALLDATRRLEGKFDLAAAEGGGLVLLDVKTAQGDAAHAAQVARHYDIQRSVYVTAAEAIGGMPVSRFAFQFSRAGVQLSTPMDDAAREEARREVAEQLAAIDRGEAPLTEHPAECRYCGFKRAGWCPGVNEGVD